MTLRISRRFRRSPRISSRRWTGGSLPGAPSWPLPTVRFGSTRASGIWSSSSRANTRSNKRTGSTMCTAAGAEYILPALIIGGLSAGGAVGSAAIAKQNVPELPKPGASATAPAAPGKVQYGANAAGSAQQSRVKKGKMGLTIPVSTPGAGSSSGAPSTGVGY